jgi:hypothetical protein
MILVVKSVKKSKGSTTHRSPRLGIGIQSPVSHPTPHTLPREPPRAHARSPGRAPGATPDARSLARPCCRAPRAPGPRVLCRAACRAPARPAAGPTSRVDFILQFFEFKILYTRTICWYDPNRSFVLSGLLGCMIQTEGLYDPTEGLCDSSVYMTIDSRMTRLYDPGCRFV